MTKKKRESGTPEWSYPVLVDKIGTSPLKVAISPDPDEIKRLAKRLNVVTLENVQADLMMSREKGGMVIFVSGQIKAKTSQNSVVSGKPVKNTIIETVEAWYADPDQAVSFAKAKQERLTREGLGEMPVMDESEDPEPVIDGKIDAGELVAQFLSLAINPYPRLEGEEFEASEAEKAIQKQAGEVYENPFAALRDWKHKQDKGE